VCGTVDETITAYIFRTEKYAQASKLKLFYLAGERMEFKILRDRWCYIIVLHLQSPTEDKTDDVKDSFYEKLERV
jgi:hypothetical protein